MDKAKEREIFININIEKSDEALEYAELAISRNSVMTALNRIYYAVFYTVSALSEQHGFKTAKHSTMMGWFNKKFVYEEKVFDKKLSKIYGDVFMYRQKGDYDTKMPADIETVKKLFINAKEFIETVRKEINDK